MTNWIDRNIKWVFTMPAVIFVALMMVAPVGYTFWLSFHEWSMSNITPPLWVAFQNYLELFQDELFIKSLKLMFYFTIVAVTMETVLGVGLAILMNQNIVGKGLLKHCFYCQWLQLLLR